MRRVPLKIVDFTGPGGEPLAPLHYSEALVVVARTPPQAGIGVTAAEMDPALAIEEAIMAATSGPGAEEGFVYLEEADWNWLCERLNANRWPFVSRTFKTLIADVERAKKVNPNAANGGVADGVDTKIEEQAAIRQAQAGLGAPAASSAS